MEESKDKSGYGKDHPWNNTPKWKKRMHGFIIYQLHSWIAIYDPIMADRVMYQVLREQFEPFDR